MSQVIKVSKPGFNVVSATAPDNLIYSSDYNTFKYYLSGTTSITIADGSAALGSTVITHNLGYRPVTFVYHQNAGYTPERWYPLADAFADAGAEVLHFSYVDTSRLIVYFEQTYFGSVVDLSPGTTEYYSYKIFRNNLEI